MIHWDAITNINLYLVRGVSTGNVLVTDGSSSEVWSTADDYDVAGSENGGADSGSGHYTFTFDGSTNLDDGIYWWQIRWRAGASAANTDIPIAKGWAAIRDNAVVDVGYRIFQRFYNQHTLTATESKVVDDDDSTNLTTMSVSDDGTTQTIGKA